MKTSFTKRILYTVMMHLSSYAVYKQMLGAVKTFGGWDPQYKIRVFHLQSFLAINQHPTLIELPAVS